LRNLSFAECDLVSGGDSSTSPAEWTPPPEPVGTGTATPGWRPEGSVPPTTTTYGPSVPVGGGVTVSPTTTNPPYSPPVHGVGVTIPIGK